ncbi:hypothetical protein E0Z10_g2186 [Xylaria hypoxylon]|uniref:Uncharacterized protein n=1 Tax=Xylaria hypoxylon TaxID=37992 RepID=A0A4Z0YQL4_9PEZI|nr:hypothetical protein E0Z10_g2186 [Xylaria hypoxylon]
MTGLRAALDCIDRLSSTTGTSSGCYVIVEDPRPEYIEVLGSRLDVNPLFFAGHIDTVYRSAERDAPPISMALYPSQLASQEFIHIHYQRSFRSPYDMSTGHRKMNLTGNVVRLLRWTTTIDQYRVGLARGCCSIYRKILANQRWICLILVDAEINLARIGNPAKIYSPFATFNGFRLEDLKPITTYSIFCKETAGLKREPRSLRENLLELLGADPPGLSCDPPSILSLIYFPARLILVEWVMYTSVMDRCVKHFERVFETPADGIPTMTSEDLKELHRWRRRSEQSLQKLDHLANFVNFWRTQEPDHPQFKFLAGDLDFAAKKIKKCDDAFKAMVPTVMSMIQIFESRKSIEENLHIKRLTVIAMIFVPLAYIATLFSMAGGYAPGQDKFWVYFTVALPALLLVFAAVQWPRISGLFISTVGALRRHIF